MIETEVDEKVDWKDDGERQQEWVTKSPENLTVVLEREREEREILQNKEHGMEKKQLM